MTDARNLCGPKTKLTIIYIKIVLYVLNRVHYKKKEREREPKMISVINAI